MAVLGFYLIECLIDELNRYAVEIFGEVGFPAQNSVLCSVHDLMTDLGNHSAATYSCLVGLAGLVEHFRHQVKQEVVGDTEYHTVHRLVYIHCAELAVVFGDLSRMGRRDFILSQHHGFSHCQPGMFVGQPDELVFPDVFAHTFLDCFRPSLDVEKHLQNLFCHIITHFICSSLHTSTSPTM